VNRDFKEGQLVAYCPVDTNKNIYRVEIGIFKRYNKDKTCAFVYYHAGSTAACTPLDLLYPIENDHHIKSHNFNSLD